VLDQLEEHATLDFRVVNLSPTLGVEITKKKINIKLKKSVCKWTWAVQTCVVDNSPCLSKGATVCGLLTQYVS